MSYHAYVPRKGKGINFPASFRPHFLLAEILVGRSPHLQVWGAEQPSVLCALSNDTVGSDQGADTVIFTNVCECKLCLIQEPA